MGKGKLILLVAVD